MPIDATVGGVSANSYCSEEFANEYFSDRLNSQDWTDSTDQAKALMTATNLLEQRQYVGTKTDSAQALKWPRSGVYDEDSIEYDDEVIPLRIKQACCEAAFALIQNPDSLSVSGLEGFESINIAQGTGFKFAKGGPAPGTLPAQVTRLLTPFILAPRVLRA